MLALSKQELWSRTCTRAHLITERENGRAEVASHLRDPRRSRRGSRGAHRREPRVGECCLHPHRQRSQCEPALPRLAQPSHSVHRITPNLRRRVDRHRPSSSGGACHGVWDGLMRNEGSSQGRPSSIPSWKRVIVLGRDGERRVRDRLAPCGKHPQLAGRSRATCSTSRSWAWQREASLNARVGLRGRPPGTPGPRRRVAEGDVGRPRRGRCCCSSPTGSPKITRPRAYRSSVCSIASCRPGKMSTVHTC